MGSSEIKSSRFRLAWASIPLRCSLDFIPQAYLLNAGPSALLGVVAKQKRTARYQIAVSLGLGLSAFGIDWEDQEKLKGNAMRGRILIKCLGLDTHRSGAGSKRTLARRRSALDMLGGVPEGKRMNADPDRKYYSCV